MRQAAAALFGAGFTVAACYAAGTLVIDRLGAVLRRDEQKGFVVLPRRWVVERTFAWLTQCRRLGKDYEVLPESSEAMIYIAMTRLMVRRLAAT